MYVKTIKTWFKFFRFLKKITCMLCIQTLTSHIFVGIHRQFRFQNFLLKMDWLIFFLEIINCNTLCDFLIFCAFWFWAQLEDFLVIVIGTISTFEVINFISPFRVKNLKGMRVIKFICRFLLIFVAFPECIKLMTWFFTQNLNFRFLLFFWKWKLVFSIWYIWRLFDDFWRLFCYGCILVPWLIGEIILSN